MNQLDKSKVDLILAILFTGPKNKKNDGVGDLETLAGVL